MFIGRSFCIYILHDHYFMSSIVQLLLCIYFGELNLVIKDDSENEYLIVAEIKYPIS